MTEPAAAALAQPQLLRPTLQTCFHIDFDWWERHGREYRVYLRSHLCEQHQAEFGPEADGDGRLLDWVHPRTAQVSRLDQLQYTLRSHCARQSEYLTQRTSMVDAVFRVFIANGNQPLTAPELAARIGRERQANTILRALAGRRVYKGMRPFQPDAGIEEK
jgi:hypothetical protein